MSDDLRKMTAFDEELDAAYPGWMNGDIKPTPTEIISRLTEVLAKVMPIRIHDGPDYAEVYFSDGTSHNTQAMTMNLQDWLDLQDAYKAARAWATRRGKYGERGHR